MCQAILILTQEDPPVDPLVRWNNRQLLTKPVILNRKVQKVAQSWAPKIYQVESMPLRVLQPNGILDNGSVIQNSSNDVKTRSCKKTYIVYLLA